MTGDLVTIQTYSSLWFFLNLLELGYRKCARKTILGVANKSEDLQYRRHKSRACQHTTGRLAPVWGTCKYRGHKSRTFLHTTGRLAPVLGIWNMTCDLVTTRTYS
jgi:hypothetical protein